MADRRSNEPRSPPRSPRLRGTFWRKIKGAFATRSLSPINCKAITVLSDAPSMPGPDKDEPPISPVSPVVSDSLHTSLTDGPRSPRSPPVERAWYTDASLSSPTPPLTKNEQSVRDSASSSPNSSLETVRGGGPHHTSTLRAISTPYLIPFPSKEPVTRPTCSTGWIWEQVAEVGMREGKPTS